MEIISKNQLLKVFVLIIVDILCAVFAVFLSVFVRYFIEYSAFPSGVIEVAIRILKYWLPANFLIYALFRMYNRLWEFASIREALRIVFAAFCSFVALVIIGNVSGLGEFKSCYLLSWLFLTVLTLGTRFFIV